ncbi:MAG: hypothetical protein Sylvanvirus2_32 [Sylvanvirus sp.]|uniref:Uncharacterized protein n=1 Tax=Sylvanvirus sp. TaxID=2487774 RepID=A0A3G5AHA8_9VIRU|nr:MAG: hypothetical protein Sylvanvirus2_32 [Sylvanvirus sp.]
MVFCLTITRFSDDYKPTGNDWSSSELRYFYHKNHAETALYETLFEFINDRDLSQEKMQEIGFKYFQIDKDCTENESNSDSDSEYKESSPSMNTKRKRKMKRKSKTKRNVSKNRPVRYVNQLDATTCTLSDLKEIMRVVNYSGEFVSCLLNYDIHEINPEDTL